MKSHLKIWLLIIWGFWINKVLQDVVGGTRPTSQTASSVSDAKLMFEFLLGGMVIDQDDVFLLDEEMASMRKGREFLDRINEGIPKSLSSMELEVSRMRARQQKPLTLDQFEKLVLSMVYSAHQAQVQGSKEERQAWGGVLLQLANITVYELRGSFLLSYS
ncbi:uncharacterized protein LOC119617475 [Kryptolebias marmoratus]|uniref:uncharacterized protein LOC119617475 n=1 Tax=Kryptolebias marmoratus TaxID=37003 RepID=UPI0018ACC2D0|nr:uncharacterized protein LOC119617475 [Kryptolebias marmoratus]